jgi:hypothetical protein
MKHVLSALAVVAALAAPAAADRIRLDYRASDASCIDATRFADEVSAKLGFVPWDASAKTKIRVRIDREGQQFSGSFLNSDGTSKVVDGASCAQVTSSLAVSVAGALDRTDRTVDLLMGSTQPRAEAKAAPDDGKVPVNFVTADGRRVDISLNTGGGMGRASDGATIVANFYEGLCTSPCTARLSRGRHFLLFQDPDSASAGGDKFLIDQPTTITLHHKSRRGLRRGLFATGVVTTAASVVGGLLIRDVGGILIASLGGGVGLGFMVSPLMIHDTFTTTRSP